MSTTTAELLKGAAELFPDEVVTSAHVRHLDLPFGAGHRRCPGRSLAKVTIKAALVRLLRRADLRLLPQRIEPVGLSAMHPKNGLRVRVEAVRP